MINELNNLAIIVQGPSTNVDKIKEAYREYNLIISTWEGSETLYDANDTVIFNKIPEYRGVMNFDLQILSTLRGIEEANNRGYKYVLKTRSDIIPTNFIKFISNLDKNKLNMFSWKHHSYYPNCPGYLTDHLMVGTVEDMHTLWNIKDTTWNDVPEIQLTHRYISKLFDKRDIRFFINDLGIENDFYWLKRDKYLSWFREMSQDGVRGVHLCSDTKEHIHREYINFLPPGRRGTES